ncbi:hypothetical protein V8G54_007250 [Vigna mungo]|uniref:Uncharacterized protein n=1 Tax=Vigna mungo TaxID=3915 RepID=A0AAQ3P505_VIGMU
MLQVVIVDIKDCSARVPVPSEETYYDAQNYDARLPVIIEFLISSNLFDDQEVPRRSWRQANGFAQQVILARRFLPRHSHSELGCSLFDYLHRKSRRGVTSAEMTLDAWGSILIKILTSRGNISDLSVGVSSAGQPPTGNDYMKSWTIGALARKENRPRTIPPKHFGAHRGARSGIPLKTQGTKMNAQTTHSYFPRKAEMVTTRRREEHLSTRDFMAQMQTQLQE